MSLSGIFSCISFKRAAALPLKWKTSQQTVNRSVWQGAFCGFCDFFMTRDARLTDRISVAGSSGCSLVYPSQQALITQFLQAGDCVTRQRVSNGGLADLTQFAMQTLASFDNNQSQVESES